MKPPVIPRSLVALAVAAVLPPAGAQTTMLSPPVEVIGTTPLAGIGVPRRHLPANVQSLDEQQLEEGENLNVADLMLRRLPSVTINEVQGNPYQVDLNYRGYTASPLLGTAQGLSVYLDGVRVNEPFGDTVNWDLIPNTAIAGLDLLPGSNPVFGLNTLGGALAVRTKSGFSHPGGKLELAAGSNGRVRSELEYGGNNGRFGWYGAIEGFQEDGWRDHSPSGLGQVFGKFSWRGSAGEADLSLLHASTSLIGNGLLPQSMLAERRRAVFTYPDRTRNELDQVGLNSRLWLSDAQTLSFNVYHRQTTTHTLNGDLNDNYASDPSAGTGVLNRTQTRQYGSGAALQWSLSGERHQLALGASVDLARLHFLQTEQEGEISADRGVGDLQDVETANRLRGTTRSFGLYATDTWALSDSLHLTLSARYQDSRVRLHDEHNPLPPNLDGDHRYSSFNPAAGLAWRLTPTVDAYAGFSQGSRVPTPIELGCADPANPCTLPNAMASDPHLKQVRSRTLEAGLRGRLDRGINWQAGVFRSLNRDDILFVGTSTSAGYFTNYGQTRRQGIELGLDGRHGAYDWYASYTLLDATFRSAACLLAENNSTAGSDAACAADEIRVQRGDRLPNLPRHTLKLGVSWKPAGGVRLGADMQAFSSQYVRGNENNRHQAGGDFLGSGSLPGYAVFGVHGDVDLGGGWQAFARVSNLFDKHYATAGALAENPFAAGAFQSNAADWRHETFVAPGAPRSFWLGLRHSFGG